MTNSLLDSANTIELSDATISKLLKFSMINQSIKLVEDKKELRSLAASRKIAGITPIAEEVPRTWCIYDIQSLISGYKLVKDPVINFDNDNFVTIMSKDGSQKLRYFDADEAVVAKSYIDKNPKDIDFDLTVTLTEEQLKSVRDAANKLRLEYIGFKSDGKNLYYSAFNKTDGNSESNTFSICVGEVEDDKEFEMFYSTQEIAIVEGSPTFNISFNKQSKVTFGDVELFVALDTKSNVK